MDDMEATPTRGRQVYVVRHGERIDFTFTNSWLSDCFDSDGNYTRRDLNQPKTLPNRGSAKKYYEDSPLTVVGTFQAALTGDAMKEAGITIRHVYASPAYRCVQTAANAMKHLYPNESVQINIEPGLFEWLAWYDHFRPEWMTPKELSDNGFNINLEYKPVISVQELMSRKTESVDGYYHRGHLVTQTLINSTSGNILFFTHTQNLDVCLKKLTNRPQLEELQMRRFAVPYCYVVMAEQSEATNEWTFNKTPLMSLRHLDNKSINDKYAPF